MAGTKESPRQKMIGMMYLVLTALLALNVSKDLLNAFVVINDGLSSTNNSLAAKSASVMDGFESQMAIDAQKTRPYFEKALLVQSTAEELDDYIEVLKRHLIKETEGYDESAPDSMYVLRNVASKDNYDIPTEILIGSEPAFPKEGANTAIELRSKIETFRSELINQFDPIKDADFIQKLERDLTLPKVPNGEGIDEPWEVGNFYHLPLAACITNLSKIQVDVRSAQSDALKSLYDNVSRESFRFDTIAAKVIPKSNYVLLGDIYEADVFLAAFSRTEQPLIQTGSFDQNSAFAASDSIPVANGLGKMSVKASKEGFHTYQGMITVTKNDGTTKTFPFESEYLVARPSLTVAPTKMNVLYKGIANPIKISVPGVPNEKLRVSITGGNQLKSLGNGQFEAEMSRNSPSIAHVKVQAEMVDGSVREMGAEEFRVKQLPKPHAEIGSIDIRGRLTNNELISKKGVRAVYDKSFEFDLPCKVTSFEMSTKYQSNMVGDISQNNLFTNKMIEIIKALPSGTEVKFGNIKAQGEDGQPHNLSPITITIK